MGSTLLDRLKPRPRGGFLLAANRVTRQPQGQEDAQNDQHPMNRLRRRERRHGVASDRHSHTVLIATREPTNVLLRFLAGSHLPRRQDQARHRQCGELHAFSLLQSETPSGPRNADIPRFLRRDRSLTTGPSDHAPGSTLEVLGLGAVRGKERSADGCAGIACYGEIGMACARRVPSHLRGLR